MKITSTPAQLNEGDEVTFTCTAETNPGTIFSPIGDGVTFTCTAETNPGTIILKFEKNMNLSDNEYLYLQTFPSL